MIKSVYSAGKTLSGRDITRLLITGTPAAYIEHAHRASFYGIRGNSRECIQGRRHGRVWMEYIPEGQVF